jgi:hypothetical protein
MTSPMQNGRPRQDGRSENITNADTNRLTHRTPGLRQDPVRAEQVCCDFWAVAAVNAMLTVTR